MQQRVEFDPYQLFSSLTKEERSQIENALHAHAQSREQERYARLQNAESLKQALVEELRQIEYAIAENDDWFRDAQEGKVVYASEEFSEHLGKAREFHDRRAAIRKNLLPAADAAVCKVITEIENEEQQEELFRRRNLEALLSQVWNDRCLQQAQWMREERRQREKEEQAEAARRREEYESLLLRLRLEEEEQREERLRNNRARIRERALERAIPYLVHFTPLSNLGSILTHGLRSRRRLAECTYTFTDDTRADGWLDWISLSVSFPNYKMFMAKRSQMKNVDGWAVILIKPDVLWERECKFVLTNAASSSIRIFSDEKWSSVQAFDAMFGREEHRKEIPIFYTTDPQAEVMIRGEVPVGYFDSVAVQNHFEVAKLDWVKGVRVERKPDLFSWRKDFEHWRKFSLAAR